MAELTIRPEEIRDALARFVEAYDPAATATQEIGVVAEVLHTAAGELLAVRRPPGQGSEVLVPFVSAIVTSVSLEHGTIEIDPPEGLLDLG